MTLAYLDTSAFIKTVVREPESERVLTWLEQWPDRASCALLRTEAVRALGPHGSEAVALARARFRALRLVQLDEQLLDAAGDLTPRVRSLDAIHLAAAMALGHDLGALVTYDVRMQAAASDLGMPIVAP